MAVRIEPVPAWPFAEWLQGRVQCWAGRGDTGSDGLRRVVLECGWDGDAGLRKLYRYRYMQRGTSIKDQRRRYKHRNVDVHTTTFPREVVEEALHNADVDFADLYVDYANRMAGQTGSPKQVLQFLAAYEPLAEELLCPVAVRQAWCIKCAEEVLLDAEGECQWCAGEREFKAKLARLAKFRADAAKKKALKVAA
jgi:hypothetical protein